jgi:hypothetical protein
VRDVLLLAAFFTPPFGVSSLYGLRGSSCRLRVIFFLSQSGLARDLRGLRGFLILGAATMP